MTASNSPTSSAKARITDEHPMAARLWGGPAQHPAYPESGGSHEPGGHPLRAGVERTIGGDAFLVFITQVLDSHLREGDFVVLDNLNTHGAPKVGAIHARGAFLLFLPRYSPNMNHIEKA